MKSLLLAAVLAASQCNPTPAPPPEPPPAPAADATCADTCAHFAFLGCAEAEPTSAGATCLDVCGNAQASPAPLDLACIVRADSCAHARRCE